MSDLFHECGIVAIYRYDPTQPCSILAAEGGEMAASLKVPRMLLDIQNRGQLAAGITTFGADKLGKELLRTHKDIGSVAEVFQFSHKAEHLALMTKHSGPAAIGHIRYSTCGKDDKSYAHPFERTHLERRKWFSFALNGQLANYNELRDEIESQGDFHLARETDTETLMHLLGQEISDQTARLPQHAPIDLKKLLTNVSARLDGSYNIVFLNARGDMFVSRDPLGFRPLCYANRGGLFVAASESVALRNLGFRHEEICDIAPGSAVIIQNGKMSIVQYAPKTSRAHCFFEWIYFSNVCSTLDGRSVYLSRKALGEELASQETVSTENAIVVPVPDTARAAAEGMAFKLGIQCLEGLMRNRAIGRTFIESEKRRDKVRMKFFALPEVLSGRRVFLVDDTIVRSTTMRELIKQLRDSGALEVHVRIACPPILAPCFYGIDMSDVDELFAPRYLGMNTPDALDKVPFDEPLTPAVEKEMTKFLGADSLKYLPVSSIATAIGRPSGELCQACLTGSYPTEAGNRLYQESLHRAAERCASGCAPGNGEGRRIFELETPARL